MKKLAIAGTSVALAAMPVMGVFAATDITTVTDTIEISVAAACSINAVTSTTTGNPENTTYSASVLNGKIASLDHDSEHEFTVVCNNNAGWKVTAGAPNDLTGSTGNNHIIDYKAEALPAENAETEGQWMAVATGDSVPAAAQGNGIADATGHIKTDGGIIATEAASTAGSTFTVTYGAYVGTETAADTYTGTIAYTLATL